MLKASTYILLLTIFTFALTGAKTLVHADPIDIATKPKEKIEKKESTKQTQEVSLNKQEKKEPAASNPRAYIVGPDDKLKITVFGENDLTGTYTVSAEGAISMPLIDEIHVEGLTLKDIKGILVHKLSDGYLVDPSVSIEVDSYRPFYILGEVRNPGSYNYVTDMSALNAVALAGGFTYRANKRNIEIMRSRNGKAVMIKDQPSDTSIVPGDIILIKERFF